MPTAPTIHVWPRDELPAGASIWPAAIAVERDAGACARSRRPVYPGVHALLAGEGGLVCGATEYEVTPGTLFCLMPGQRLTCRAPAALWEGLWLHVVGPGAESWQRSLGLTDGTPVVHPRASARVISICRRLLGRYRRRQPASACGVVASLYELSAVADTRSPAPADPTAALVARAETAAAGQFPTYASVSAWAADLEVDRTTLFRAFRRHRDHTPVAHLIGLRVNHACELLAATRMRIAQVAAVTGFGSNPYFCRRFRQSTGVTPTQYRARQAAVC